MLNRERTATVAAISAAVLLASVADAQSAETVTGQITARLLNDGRIEFGWQPSVGARVLPRLRFFPSDPTRGQWLNSSQIVVDGKVIGQINARRLDSGRTEFTFTPTSREPILPPNRYFPTSAQVNKWLRSSVIVFNLPGQAGNADDGSVQSSGPTVAEMEADILRALFGDGRGRSSGNDWGCPFTAANSATCLSRRFYESRQVYEDQRAVTRWNAYVGGHNGWDASHPDRNREFRSLTAGTVILAGTNLSAYPRSCNDIAVYDRSGGITTIYLHAEDVRVKQGDRVEVGELLGTEGASCPPGGEHVHIEIRRGRPDVAQGRNGPRIYARGAGQQPGHQLPCAEVSIDPIPYLYRSATGRSVPDSSGWQRCDDGT